MPRLLFFLLLHFTTVPLLAQNESPEPQRFKVNQSYYSFTLNGLSQYAERMQGSEQLRLEFTTEVARLKQNRRLGLGVGVGGSILSAILIGTSFPINANAETEVLVPRLVGGSLLLIPAIIGFSQIPDRHDLLNLINLHNEHPGMEEPIQLSGHFSSTGSPVGFGLTLAF